MLTISPGFFALSDPLIPNPIPDTPVTQLFGLGLRDILLIIGVALIVGLILFMWVYLTHKSRHQSSGHQLSRPIYRAEKISPEVASRRVKTRKKRRRHPDNLPRNPTLGETGGLPPLRPEEPPESAQPH